MLMRRVSTFAQPTRFDKVACNPNSLQVSCFTDSAILKQATCAELNESLLMTGLLAHLTLGSLVINKAFAIASEI